MKGLNLVVSIGLIALCLLGWTSMATSEISEGNTYKEYIVQADTWVEEGLYQRAIALYEAALSTEPTEEIYEKVVNAYWLRYEEEPEKTEESFYTFIKRAAIIYPGNQLIVDSCVKLGFSLEKYKDVYSCLVQAISNGYDSDEVRENMRKAQYNYTLRRNEFTKIIQSVGNVYTIKDESGWRLYSKEEGYLLSEDCEYVSMSNNAGDSVVTNTDSRLISGSGVVLGIFENKISDAGVYSEGFVAACVDGKYAYYDEFAKKQFGDYEEAGMFQNGMAAVKQNGKWMLINNLGEVASESFEEIVLDAYGRYIINDIILVKTGNGKYCLYDKEWAIKAEITCDDTDAYSEDGLFAVCINDKWGFVNEAGDIVIQPEYSQAKSFSNGVAAVCKDGLWGFIDKENHLVIEHQFRDAGYMDDLGICPVRVDIPKPEDAFVVEAWQFLELTLGIVAE